MPAPDEVTIVPGRCYTKSAYARKINKTPTWVGTLIEKGKLKVVNIIGCSFIIHEEQSVTSEEAAIQ